MNDKKQLFDYRTKIEDANYHAVNLLVLLKKIDAVCMPVGITINEIEELYTNISDLTDYIDKKRYWRLNK